MDINNEFIENFRTELPVLRAMNEMSQEIVANSLGISRQTYNGIETGKKNMSNAIFLALVALFQNNERTKRVIESMDGFEDVLSSIVYNKK